MLQENSNEHWHTGMILEQLKQGQSDIVLWNYGPSTVDVDYNYN